MKNLRLSFSSNDLRGLVYLFDELQVKLERKIEMFVERGLEFIFVVLVQQHHAHDLCEKQVRRVLDTDVADLASFDAPSVEIAKNVLQHPTPGVEFRLQLGRQSGLDLVPLNEIENEEGRFFLDETAQDFEEGCDHVAHRLGGRRCRAHAVGELVGVAFEDAQVYLFLAAEILINRGAAEVGLLGDHGHDR